MATSQHAPLSTEHLEQAAQCFRVLAHPMRLKMIDHLLSDRYTVGELAELCEIRPNVASEHLRLMEHCQLLSKTREGRCIYYTVAHTCLESLMDCIRHRFG